MSGLADVTEEQMEEAMLRSCDEQVSLLEKAKKQEETQETVNLIKNTYGDVIRRLANE